MNAKEMIAEIITDGIWISGKQISDIAEAILNLRYPCRACNGSGDLQLSPNEYPPYTTKRCPSCNGTGKGGRMLAVLDEKQELPQRSADTTIWITELRVQQDMITQGWRKTIQESE